MYRIRTFNKISPVGLNRLDPALYTVSDSETDEDAMRFRPASARRGKRLRGSTSRLRTASARSPRSATKSRWKSLGVVTSVIFSASGTGSRSISAV